MKKKSIFVYSIVVSAIFALSLISFALSIFQEYKNGERRAKKDFDNILFLIDKEDIENPQTQYKINFHNFASLLVQKNQEIVISYPSFYQINEEPTKFIKVYEIQVYKNNARYTVQASIYVLRPEIIFKSAKTSFIIIAICTILTTALIFILKTTENQNQNENENENEINKNSSKIVPIISKDSKIHSLISNNDANLDRNEEPELFPLRENEDDKLDDKFDLDENLENNNEEADKEEVLDSDSSFEDETAPVIKETASDPGEKENHEVAYETSYNDVENSIEDDENEIDFDEPLITDQERQAINAITFDETFENSDEKQALIQTEYEAENISEQKSDTNNNEDLSPVTGVKWERLLEKKLDEDLIEAGACEQDLALFIINISDYSFTDSVTNDIVSYLEKEFQTKDRIFEYKNNSFAVIHKDTSIEDAESIADTVQANITNMINANGSKCYIGISARTTRVLSASRLILEADQALNHAKEEADSPIIGFHVDIEKYKEYIKNL